MADIVKVYDSELQECANKYMQSLDKLRDCVSVYQKALEALQNDWTGRAFAIMSAHVVDFVAKIAASFLRVNDAVSELTEIRVLLEETETMLTRQADALDIGTQSEFQG